MQRIFKVIYSNASEETTFAKFTDLDKALSFVLIPDSELPWHRFWTSFKEINVKKPKLAQWTSADSTVFLEEDYA